MVGTALHLDRFLLIEHPGPWPFHALEADGIADVVPGLVEATRAAGARTFLIRRPGRQTPSPLRAWAVADVRANRILWGEWEQPADLLQRAVPALRADSDGWSSDPAFLVCAHGRHDTCCAVRGRPVAAALAERWPHETWECSHVGGDRFAANLVVVPDGTYYGSLDGRCVPDVVEGHLADQVDTTFLRGSSALAPPAQAVAAAALERWGPAGARAIIEHRVEQLSDSSWSVRLKAAAPLPEIVTATVLAETAEPAVLTCQAPRPTSARRFVVDHLQGLPLT